MVRLVNLCLALFALGISGVNAQTVTLQSLDGSVSMIGELQSFKNDVYVIKTRVGEVSIGADGVVCVGDNCPSLDQTARFSIEGSNTIGVDLMPRLMAEYAKTNDFELIESVGLVSGDDNREYHADYQFEDDTGEFHTEIAINSNGAETAFDALLVGEAEIVMSSRAVRNDETLAFLSVGLGDISSNSNQIIIALDGLIILVSRENPLASLSISQIASIFAGDITNWREVGGADQRINLYRRGESAGTTQDFMSSVMAPRQLQFAENMTTAGTDAELSSLVARDPNGIGYSGFAFENNAQYLALRDTCGSPISPTEFNLKTGEYPLARRLYLYTSEQLAAEFSRNRAEKFNMLLSFFQSDRAQNAVTDSGFVSQSVTELPIDQQGRRLLNAVSGDIDAESFAELQKMIAELRDAKRLSTTFRFRDNNPVLDGQSAQDVARLAGFLQEQDLTGKEVVFSGFTDAVGSAVDNRNVSQAQARRALELVRTALGDQSSNIQLTARGYGQIAPLTCNGTVFGRAINRRVEVWIRAIE